MTETTLKQEETAPCENTSIMFLFFSFTSSMSNLPLPRYITSSHSSSHPHPQLLYFPNSPFQVTRQILCSYYFLQSFKSHFIFPNSCLLPIPLQCFSPMDLREHTVILNLFLYLFFFYSPVS